MKKVFIFTLAMVLALSLLAACGGNNETDDSTEPTTRAPMDIAGGTRDEPTTYLLGDTIVYDGSSSAAYCKMHIEEEILVSVVATDGKVTQNIGYGTMVQIGALTNRWEISSDSDVSISEEGQYTLLPGDYIISFRLDEMNDIAGTLGGLGVTCSGGSLKVSAVTEND